jgi:hypothetical protein
MDSTPPRGPQAMSESEAPQPKKRHIWQLHLNTAVLMMIVVGVLLWLNLIVSAHMYSSRTTDQKGIEYTNLWAVAKCGWPIAFVDDCVNDFWTDEEQAKTDVKSTDEKLMNAYCSRFDGRCILSCEIEVHHWRDVVMDIVIATGLLGLCAYVSEFLIRRREDRKP